MRCFKIFNRILGICTLAMALNACVCEPPPERKDFYKLDAQSYTSTYDTNYTIAISLETKYNSTTTKSKKFGCVGYRKILGFYYGDTLNPKTVQLICDQTVGKVYQGENWVGHAHTNSRMFSDHGSLPLNALQCTLVIGRKQMANVGDTLRFHWSAKDSKNAAYTDSFTVVLNK